MCRTMPLDQFNDNYLSWKFPQHDPILHRSIQTHGIMSPVLCDETSDGLALLDGQKRYTYAKQLGIPTLPYALIPQKHPVYDCVHALHTQDLNASVIQKIRFIRVFQSPLTPSTLHKLGLPFYSHIKKDVDRIANLPTPYQQFLHEKRYAFREIINLLNQSLPLFRRYIDDAPYFQFTKRSFDELLCLSATIIKRQGLLALDFLNDHGYHDCLADDVTPANRYKAWFHRLTVMASPRQRQAIESVESAIDPLRDTLRIQYDRTLETPGFTIESTIASRSSLTEFVAMIQNPQTQDRLHNLLDLI